MVQHRSATRIPGLLLGSLASLLGLVVALVVLLSLIPLDWLKPTINEHVTHILHRPFAIRGNLGLDWQWASDSWLPIPVLRAGELTLGNPDDFDVPENARPMVHLGRVEAGLVLPALLTHRIEVPRVTLSRLDADLVRLADGSNNWTFAFGDSEQKGRSDETGSGWKTAIDDVVFDRGRVRYRDARRDADLTVTVDPLGKPVPYEEIVGRRRDDQGNGQQPAVGAEGAGDYVFGWTVDGRYKGQPLEGQGKIGGLLSLRDGDHPFPLQADVRNASTHIALAGTLIDPLHFGGLDLRLKFSGQNLGDLYGLTGIVLPDTPPYSTNGHLTARLDRAAGSRFEYRNFNATIGDSDLHGNLRYVADEPRPKLTGTLASKQLRFADLAPLIGANKGGEKQNTPPPPGKVLPVDQFDTSRWSAMDADVRFTAKRIEHGASLPLSDLSTHVVLDNGEILLDPLRFGVAGGALNTTLRLEGNRSPMRARIDMHARRLQLSRMMPNLGDMEDALGQLNGDATLSGRGNSVAALLGSSSGNVKLLIDNGLISRNLMELAGLNVGNFIVGELFGDEQVRINCAAADLIFRNGLVRPRLFTFDTQNAVINVDGAVDLGSEQMDLTIDPESKGFRIFTLRSPLYVSGTFKNPAPGVKAGPLAARAAAAIALGTVAAPASALLALVSPSGGSDNQCQSVLARLKRDQ